MGILGWIVLGLVVGVLAKMIIPGRDPGGIIITVLIGVAGALLGGFIGRSFLHTNLGSFFDLRTWGLGLLGSVVLLIAYRLITRTLGGRRGFASRR
jgi:uncharacterized membrane protein YeaQ/YmgE (transglycosylase-associated protein family)